MQFRVDSWHRRLNEWTYGDGMFREFQRKSDGRYGYVSKSVNLCPYARRLLFAIIGAPFLYIWRILDEKLWAQVLFLVACVDLSVSAVPVAFGFSYLLGLSVSLVINAITFGAFGALLGIVVLIERIERWSRARHDKQYSEWAKKGYPRIQPNPLVEALKASHNKVCPIIQWDDQK